MKRTDSVCRFKETVELVYIERAVQERHFAKRRRVLLQKTHERIQRCLQRTQREADAGEPGKRGRTSLENLVNPVDVLWVAWLEVWCAPTGGQVEFTQTAVVPREKRSKRHRIREVATIEGDRQ